MQKKHEQEILTNYKNEDNDLTEVTDAHEETRV